MILEHRQTIRRHADRFRVALDFDRPVVHIARRGFIGGAERVPARRAGFELLTQQKHHLRHIVACDAIDLRVDGNARVSPLEFDVFIQRTTASTENTSGLFGALGSIYTVGTVIGCLAAALLLSRNWVAHRLMRDGMLLWVIGVLLSAFGFWAPNGMLSFVIFSGDRTQYKLCSHPHGLLSFL